MKISLREILLATTIVALVIPYVYRAVACKQLDFGQNALREIVEQIQPNANYQGGAVRPKFVEMMYIIPTVDGETFTNRLHQAILDKINQSGWIATSSHIHNTHKQVTQFSYDLRSGPSRSSVHFFLIFRQGGKYQKIDCDMIRFAIMTPNVP